MAHDHDLKPLLVSVKQARHLLGGISNNLFWRYAPRLELVGTERKRWVTLASVERLCEQLLAEARRASQPKPEAQP